jgi:tellurium resistance protein TerD
MGINLIKGQRIDIGLTRMMVGLGWKPNEAMSDNDFDLDVSAFLLGKNKKIINDDYLVFYNSEKRVHPDNLKVIEPMSPTKYPSYTDEDGEYHTSDMHWREQTRPIDTNFSVIGSIDDTEGGEGDVEFLDIDLTKVNANVEEIIIVVTIYDYEARKQNFGQVRNSYIRIVDNSTSNEIAKYELDEDFSVETAVEFGRLYKKGTEWKFEAMGIGYKGGLQYFVDKYV